MSIRKKFLRSISSNYKQQHQQQQQKDENYKSQSARAKNKSPTATNAGNALLARTWKTRVRWNAFECFSLNLVSLYL